MGVNFEHNAIKPTMSVYNGIALVATMMIGSGVFIIPAIVVAKVQSIGMAIILWFVVAFISACGSNSFVELGMMFPKSGGALTYLAYSFKKPKFLVSFVFCITQILVIWPAMIASELDATSKQLLYNVETTPWLIKLSSVILLTIIVLINFFSVDFAMKLSTGLTYIKFYTLYAMCIAGVFAYCGISVNPIAKNVVYFDKPSTNPSDYASAVFKLLWVWDGWNNLNYAIEEMVEPKRDFPRAVFGGVGITGILYLLTNFFFITIVPYDQILTSDLSIASVYCKIIFGEFIGQKMVPFLIFLSCYATTDNMVYGVSRIIHAASRSRIVPFHTTFSKLDENRGTPRNALIYTWAISAFLILMPFSDHAFEFFLQMAIYPKWIFYSLAVIGLLYLRWSEPFFVRPVKSYIFCSVVLIIASIFLAIFPLMGSDMVPSVISLGVMALSAMLYFVMRKQVVQADFGFDDEVEHKLNDACDIESSHSIYSDSKSNGNKSKDSRDLKDTIYSEVGDYQFVSEPGSVVPSRPSTMEK